MPGFARGPPGVHSKSYASTAKAIEEKEGVDARAKLKLPPAGPLFLENPDGTIAEAVPLTHKEPKIKAHCLGGWAGRGRQAPMDSDNDSTTGGWTDLVANSMYQEVDYLYSRHERVMIALLLVQLLLESLYDVVYILRMTDGSAVFELRAMYSWSIRPRSAERMFWAVFAIHVAYSLGYYVLAAVAVWLKQPKYYQMFANVSVFRVVGLVLLAYVDKFNLIMFFLQLLTYMYARFLQGITASLLLLPPP